MEKIMSTIKNGKKPLSSKTKPKTSYDDMFGNMLELPVELKKELSDQNLDWHFIDYKRYYEAGAMHPRGWVIYKSKNNASATMNLQDFGLGRDPEGIVRRGSLALAVKTMEKADAHREFLKDRASRSKSVNRDKANELRQIAREAQLEANIHEGYEENED
jgi:hypothetical protein